MLHVSKQERSQVQHEHNEACCRLTRRGLYGHLGRGHSRGRSPEMLGVRHEVRIGCRSMRARGA